MTPGQTKSILNKDEFIKSIDSLFLKLELSYHYQFYKVFGTDDKLKEGKKLWAISLKNISSGVILEAIENVISSQSYLPTLTDLLKACEDINNDDGFPSVEEAYVEARRSYQPRKEFDWSHPVIYFVGKKNHITIKELLVVLESVNCPTVLRILFRELAGIHDHRSL